MQLESPPPFDPPTPAGRRVRSLYIPGFVVGFLLLAAVTCGGSLYAAGIDAGRIAELRSDSAAWTPPPTPTLNPMALASPVAGDATSAYTYAPGDAPRNITSSLVNIRRSPGYLGKASDDVLAQVVPGQQVEILDGPQSSDGLLWWHVRLMDGGRPNEGWIAEATGSGVQILGD